MEVTLVGEASRRKSLKSNVKTGRVTERKTKNGKEITKYRDTAEGSDDDRDSGILSFPNTTTTKTALMFDPSRY
jgi:hypothetical protein